MILWGGCSIPVRLFTARVARWQSLIEDAFCVTVFFCLAFACLTSCGEGQNKRIDQSEASGEQPPQPIRRVERNCIDQSEASGKQAHRPIRTVGRTNASTNQKSFTKQRRSREGAAQPIRFHLAGSIGGRLVTPEGRTFFGLISFLRILHQVRTTDQPTRSLHRSNSDGLSSDRLSSG